MVPKRIHCTDSTSASYVRYINITHEQIVFDMEMKCIAGKISNKLTNHCLGFFLLESIASLNCIPSVGRFRHAFP